MTADDLVWEEPRTDGRARGVWPQFVRALQQQPGRWAIARQGRKSSYGREHKRLKALGCEATQRKQDDGTFTLYARWPEGGAS